MSVMVERRPNVAHPFLEHPGPLAFAHRGGAGEAPENTMSAFAHAYDLGYRWFETDVRSTADGELVVFHDPTLRRTAGVPQRVDVLDLNALERARPGGEPVMRFVDVVYAFPDVRFNVDPKDDAAAVLLASVVREHELLERVCIASFSDARLAWLRVALGPDALTALAPREVMRLARAAKLRRSWRPRGVHVVQVPAGPRWLPLVDRSFVHEAHAVDLAVHVWTVDDSAAMLRLLDLGVDGLMTDRPGVLRDVLRARGAWFGAESAS